MRNKERKFIRSVAPENLSCIHSSMPSVSKLNLYFGNLLNAVVHEREVCELLVKKYIS